MNKDWLKVLIAAVFEVIWVVGLKHAEHLWAWMGTGIAILVSFSLMIETGKRLPTGTVYAVFVGLGTAGTVLAEMVFFAEPFNPIKLALIAVLLVGVIGLKVVTKEKGANS
jgi:paired small multidrug resistance pump